VKLAIDNDPRKTLSLKIFEVIFSRPFDFNIKQDYATYHEIRDQIHNLEDHDKYTSEYVVNIPQDELVSVAGKGLCATLPIFPQVLIITVATVSEGGC